MIRLLSLTSLSLAAFLVANLQTNAETAASLERGTYLVNGIAACASCHTPVVDGKPGPSLSGGKRLGSGENAVLSPNITMDQETGIGSWSNAQIIDAIRNNRRPDGTHIAAPMPQTFRFMSDRDVKSIVLYMHSLPAVSHKVPARSTANDALVPSAEAQTVAEPDVSDPIKRGEYIADALAHCSGCHTDVSASAPQFTARKNKGGRIFKTAAGPLVAPSIRKADLTGYTDKELVNIITKGLRPDGSTITGPMPIAAYSRMSTEDLSDLILFLRHQ